MTGRRITAVFLALVALGLAAGRDIATVQAAEPYQINVVEPMTGNGSFIGTGQSRNLKVFEKLVNAQGGIDGRPLQFLFHDDQTTPQTTVQIVNGLLPTHPAVVLGMSLVAACNAVMPLVVHGPVVYCLTPGAHPPPGSFAFSSSVSTTGLVKAALRYFRLKGWTRIAMISSTDATGQDIDRTIDGVMAEPENRGMTMVAHPHFNLSDVSVAAQMERIKAARPQAMIAWTTGAAVATLFRAYIQAGLDIPVLTTNGNQTFAQMQQYAAFLPAKLLLTSALFPEHAGVYRLDPRVEKAQNEMYAALKAADMKADNMTTITWDVGRIVVAGLRRLGPQASAGQLRNYIAGLTDFAGINGLYDFKKYPQRGLGDEDAIVVRFDARRKAWVWMSKPGGTPLVR